MPVVHTVFQLVAQAGDGQRTEAQTLQEAAQIVLAWVN
jgi:hypothetical protein